MHAYLVTKLENFVAMVTQAGMDPYAQESEDYNPGLKF
jgi:hypothetical protein